VSGISLGVIGAGWVTTACALPALAETAAITVRSIYDLDRSATERALCLAPRATGAVTLDELLSAVEAVYLATPTGIHVDMVERAIRAGRHVLCEKPLALHPADAARLHDLAASKGLHLSTAFNQRFHAAHAHIAQLLRTEALGEIAAVRLTYCCWTPADPDHWRSRPEGGGGSALLDLAPHGLDLARFLVGVSIEDLHVMKGKALHGFASDDSALITGRFGSGALFSQHVAYNWNEAFPRRTLEVVGARAMIRAENTLGQGGGGAVVLWRAGAKCAEPLPVREIERSPYLAMFERLAENINASRGGCLIDEVDVVDQTSSLLQFGRWRRQGEYDG
jgi:1,5-anhydro-D-fructose reductase (1,5-anhydro-D-mannitol-forming)